MLKKEDNIRIDKRKTRNGYEYGTYVFLCKKCDKEIYLNSRQMKDSSGCCRACYDKYIKPSKFDLATRICSKCSIEQDIAQFTSINGVYCKKVCHKCTNLKKYNINYRNYLNLLNNQGNKCAICLNEETIHHRNKINKMPLSVDHDHKTGEIRGLLCYRCNSALGLLYDNKENLLKAYNYLNKKIFK